jgi:hypothetical protein
MPSLPVVLRDLEVAEHLTADTFLVHELVTLFALKAKIASISPLNPHSSAQRSCIVSLGASTKPPG